MDISVIGASAGVGLGTVRVALDRGHRVTTLSRSVESLPEHGSLTAVRGTATSADDVRMAVADADAVLVTLGTRKLGATTLFSDAASALVAAVAGRQVPLIVVTGFGTGDSAQFQNPVLRVLMSSLLGRVYADKARMEDILTASEQPWEIVQPGPLSNRDAAGGADGITSFHKGMKVPGISRKDLAAFLVDEAEQRRYLRRRVLPAVRP